MKWCLNKKIPDSDSFSKKFTIDKKNFLQYIIFSKSDPNDIEKISKFLRKKSIKNISNKIKFDNINKKEINRFSFKEKDARSKFIKSSQSLFV